MSCNCAQTAFTEYFTAEVERLGQQLVDFPETFKDLWSDLAVLEQDEVATEAIATVAQGALSGEGLGALVDLLKTEVQSQLSPTQVPRFESALEELARAKDTQDGIKVLASLVFIFWSDSVFHVLNTLAKKIVRISVLKLATLARIKAGLVLAERAMGAFDAAGVDSQEIRDIITAAALDVASAESLVAAMRKRSVAGTELREVSITAACDAIQAALDKLIDASVDPELIAAGQWARLLASSDPLAVATGGMLTASLHIAQAREDMNELESQDRQIQAALLSFKAGISNAQNARLTNYQYTILTDVQTRLTSTKTAMRTAATQGSMAEIARGAPKWVATLGVAKEMLKNLPPEVRQRVELNEELVAAHAEAVRRIESISGTHITAGAESTADLVGALRHTLLMMENLFGQVRTDSIANNAEYLAVRSDTGPFTTLAFVVAEPEEGTSLVHRVIDSTTVVGAHAFAPATPAISRLDESIIGTQLVLEAMQAFIEVQPPENVAVTALLELMRQLQMNRGRDLLLAGDLQAFMDAGPLQWTYAGNAVDCIQNGMAAALDAGQAQVYDQLDTILAPLQARVSAVQLRMTRRSAYSLETLLERIRNQISELDATKESVVGLMNKVDC